RAPSLPSLPTRRSSDLFPPTTAHGWTGEPGRACEIVVFQFPTVPEPLRSLALYHGWREQALDAAAVVRLRALAEQARSELRQPRSEEHTSELQSPCNLV